jgi:hypothetical protein
MSRGIDESLTFLSDLIESIVPKKDIYHNFISNMNGDGAIDNIENIGNQTRLFEFRLDSLSEDDGQAGISGRKRIQITLRVRYDIGRDKGYLDRMMSEDSSYLINALKGPDYNFNITGIVSLILKNATLSTITNREGVDLAYVLNIPFDLLLMED